MRIGLLVGVEDTFPRALGQRLLERSEGSVTTEMVRLGGTREHEDLPFDLVIDRISHVVLYYRHWVRLVASLGVRVVNDPMLTGPGERFFEWGVARELGISVPRAVLLPQKDYPETVFAGSLQNLVYPVPWAEHLDYVGIPAMLRPAGWDRWSPGFPVHSLHDLISLFDRSGRECVMLTQGIEADRWVRCLVFGPRVIVTRYDPEYRQHLVDPSFLEPEIEELLVHQASALARRLGHTMCAVDFAVTEQGPMLADFVNPVPDLEQGTLTPYYFERVVDAAASTCLDLLAAPRLAPSDTPRAPKAGPLTVELLCAPMAEPDASPVEPSQGPTKDTVAKPKRAEKKRAVKERSTKERAGKKKKGGSAKEGAETADAASEGAQEDPSSSSKKIRVKPSTMAITRRPRRKP